MEMCISFSQNARLSFRRHHCHRRCHCCFHYHHYFIPCWIYCMHLEQQSIYMTANILTLKINNPDTIRELSLGSERMRCANVGKQQTNTHSHKCTFKNRLYSNDIFIHRTIFSISALNQKQSVANMDDCHTFY